MKKLVMSGDYGYLFVETCEDKAFLHFESEEWSLSSYKKMLDDWAVFLETCKDLGIDELYSIINKEDTKTLKFQELFGLEVIAEHQDMFVIHRIQI